MPVSFIEVSADEHDSRLDRWLRRRYPFLGQGVIQKLCRTGQIRIEGKRAEASSRVEQGQTVRIPPLPQGPAEEDKKRSTSQYSPDDIAHNRAELQEMTLYEDDDLLVINKPSGLAVQGGSGIKRHVDGLLESLALSSLERFRLVHRIDRETSGLLLVAKTAGVAAKLAALFKDRSIKKTYWAVVYGVPTPREGIIDTPLIPTIKGGEKVMVSAARKQEGALRAITEYEVKGYAGRKMAWLELSPHTGRTHQLRAHCAAMGTPIIGDARYGVQTEISVMEKNQHRLHLHARKLEFLHPRGGVLQVVAPLPDHMDDTFRALGFMVPKQPVVSRN
ncbi:RluA family pseudouridine synthase [Entomobacter blattae]|uniref:Pseudouridine synthase n=1 Tax=Entomobacter blattae TaxID=2762277 RepID=A0A7H1NT65_9PROT|nr:RluA family pseudouridine synthase [Entomobacter blattae]QNT78975.1 Ribosomal large subunit pseudouridine synthase C [Entomobacter blattae]